MTPDELAAQGAEILLDASLAFCASQPDDAPVDDDYFVRQAQFQMAELIRHGWQRVPPADTTFDTEADRFRTGNHNSWTVWRIRRGQVSDERALVTFDPAFGPEVVDALNAWFSRGGKGKP